MKGERGEREREWVWKQPYGCGPTWLGIGPFVHPAVFSRAVRCCGVRGVRGVRGAHDRPDNAAPE